MGVPKPVWSSSSFLLYAGAFAVLGAAVSADAYLAATYGDGALAGWTALIFGVLLALAVAFRGRTPWLTGGLFVFLAVIAFGTFVGALFRWWGWNGEQGTDNPFAGWHWVAWALIVLVVVAAAVALALYRFPLLVLPIAVLLWFLVTDFVSGGGSWSAVVTLLVGGFYLGAGLGLDRGRARPYGFWAHVVAGLLVGGALLFWWHSSTADWWLLFVAALLYVAVGTAVRRSSWTVLGVAGLTAVATHFSIDWARGEVPFTDTTPRDWAPIVVSAFLGFLLVLLGLLAARRGEPTELPPS